MLRKKLINNPLKILYFTDLICSTCWLIQPILQKLKLEHDDYLDIDYKTGGLLPSNEVKKYLKDNYQM